MDVLAAVVSADSVVLVSLWEALTLPTHGEIEVVGSGPRNRLFDPSLAKESHPNYPEPHCDHTHRIVSLFPDKLQTSFGISLSALRVYKGAWLSDHT
jgi:hypothetical protein